MLLPEDLCNRSPGFSALVIREEIHLPSLSVALRTFGPACASKLEGLHTGLVGDAEAEGDAREGRSASGGEEEDEDVAQS